MPDKDISEVLIDLHKKEIILDADDLEDEEDDTDDRYGSGDEDEDPKELDFN